MSILKKTQQKVDYGKEVMTALNGNNVVIADSNGVLFQIKNKKYEKGPVCSYYMEAAEKQETWRKTPDS